MTLVSTHHCALCSWFWDTMLLWADCYRLPCNMTTPPLVRVLYCVEMGYYLQVLILSTRAWLATVARRACIAVPRLSRVVVPATSAGCQP